MHHCARCRRRAADVLDSERLARARPRSARSRGGGLLSCGRSLDLDAHVSIVASVRPSPIPKWCLVFRSVDESYSYTPPGNGW